MTWPILDLYKRTVRRPGAWFVWRWWEQEGLDLAYASYQAAEAADGEEGRRREEAA